MVLVAVSTHPLMDVCEKISEYWDAHAMTWGSLPFEERLALLARRGLLHIYVAAGEERLQERHEAHLKYCRENGTEPNRQCERCGRG